MNLTQLKQCFLKSASKYTDDIKLIFEIYKSIEVRYDNRFYHNLYHIKLMIESLIPVRDKIKDYDLLLFSVFYHDIFYIPYLDNNEEESANIAEKELKKINIPPDKIETIKSQILLTKFHLNNTQIQDADYLIDADLFVLGSSWFLYENNSFLIRNEYSFLPDAIWKERRIQFLKNISNRNSIYLSSYFKEKYEQQAVENITKEILNLLRKPRR